MDIKVRLFATLRQNRGKELIINLPTASTPMDIIRKLSISKEDIAILLINGRDGEFIVELVEGDTVSIFPPVGGG
ncbi:MoaD/ThiS family protein [Alkaliphilus sp. MSJ-5]|uniref:MoaD/ThiS family protein n=1 Tax=Alkaliphilus flagellatus TaxID=2841507 RepID=A0ABS6G0K8_9FIRM|nr:MoaD/ThiS family protein [Alkaliphilus flagellatus]MBU5676029.1 MoaD/ThiS family protein [Alkaliphilus flagellatus]